MPHSYTIDTRRGLMCLRASGVLTIGELLEARERAASEPEFDRSFPTLIDLRDVTRFERDRAVIRRLAERPMLDHRTMLAILPPTSQPYGLANLFAAYARIRGRTVRVFTDAGAAEKWLIGDSPSSVRDPSAAA